VDPPPGDPGSARQRRGTAAPGGLVDPASIVGSICFAAADLTWLFLARPPGAWYLLGWFATAVVAGLFATGPANQVTLARAHLAAPALVYSLDPSTLLGLAATVTLAGASDILDGTVARRLGHPSRLGGALDPVVDGVFYGAVAIGLGLGGAYPTWLAVVVVARYALPALAGTVLLLAGRRPILRHTPLGQASTTLIALVLGGLALFRGLGLPTEWLVIAGEVVIPLATLATFANLASANWSALTVPVRESEPGK
jgi:cardiolipin synthase